jgi:hypothetical protein
MDDHDRDHDHHDDHDRHDDHDHPPFFVPKAPPPDWHPDHHDADHPDYRQQFTPHPGDDNDHVTALQFAVSMLEQRVASLEALTSIQSAMLKAAK